MAVKNGVKICIFGNSCHWNLKHDKGILCKVAASLGPSNVTRSALSLYVFQCFKDTFEHTKPRSVASFLEWSKPKLDYLNMVSSAWADSKGEWVLTVNDVKKNTVIGSR